MTVEASIAPLIAQLEHLKTHALSQITQCQSIKELDDLRVLYLGKKGQVSSILRQVGEISPALRPQVGQVANAVQEVLVEQLAQRKEYILKQQAAQPKNIAQIDLSLPARLQARGVLHPLIQTAQDILAILNSLGFRTADGPELEYDFFNFEALNIPKNHPARDMQDTFYVSEDVVLRTQTSPVQIRAMLRYRSPPVRVASFGRVFRRDQDITHSPVFHQIEGLYVDKQVSFAELKGTLEYLLQSLFDKNTKIRMRPSYFPFTEPSVEVDMSCFSCKTRIDSNCRLCKATGWIEILGAGMVDPNVFDSVHFDPEQCSGFAFGMGIERVAMLRHGIGDIRLFYENDIRFLKQFK